MCGTDGVTYDNICILRSTSANARLDYTGDCVNEDGNSVESICERVRQENRCSYSTANCSYLVQPKPEEGCCPICGKSPSIIGV